MKILQLCSAKSFGGGERHLADLANGLAARGHEVHAVLRPGSPLLGELTALHSANISSLPLRNALDAISAHKLSAYIDRHKIEVVHAHLGRDYPLAFYATRRNPGCKLIITRHVLFPLNRLHSITLSGVSRVIAVSPAVKRSLTGLLPEEKIVVVPNGIDLGKFEDTRSASGANALRCKWNIGAGDLLIGTVGTITPLKGHEEFLQAAEAIGRSFPNARFVIAGVDSSERGENLAALEHLISQLHLKDTTQIVGWVENLPSFYRALDVFVSASHSESFGLAIAEAMASGVSVVATETEGAQEIIVPQQSGLLAPVKDVEQLAAAITVLLEDADKRQRLGEAGRARIAERFSIERMIGATERIYREILMDKV